jgi:hypothetical protein
VSGAGALLLEGEGIGKTLPLTEERSHAADAGARRLPAHPGGGVK